MMYFTTQRYLGDTYISRCTASNGVISKIDYIILPGFGHGESIEVTEYDSSTNTYTIWVGSTAANNAKNEYWSTTVSRIKYRVSSTSTTGASCTEVKTLTSILSAAGQTGTSYRASVSVAESENRICFSTQKGTGVGSWYFVIYSLSEISSAVNSMPAGSSKTLSSLGVTPKSTVSFGDSNLPNGSFQGQDIVGVGTGNKFLFIAGGRSEDDAIVIQFLYTNGNNITETSKYTFRTGSNAPSTDFLYLAEIEGVKIYNNRMYMIFKAKGSRLAKLYSCPLK